MNREPAKRAANVAPGMALPHRTAPLRQARPPCPDSARRSAKPGLLRRLLGWAYRPNDHSLLDTFSGHLLRDIGIEPDGREDESKVRFRRRR